MKKTIICITMFLLSLTLMACPVLTTQPLEADAKPVVEALFDLPEGVSVVSETFDFVLIEPSYNSIPNMTVTGTYVIQNNGNDVSMNLIHPSLEGHSLYDVQYIKPRLTINYLQEEFNWTYSNDPDLQMIDPEYTYDYFSQFMFQNLIDPSTIIIDKYKFYCPKTGTSQELTLSVSENTFIMYGWYMETTDGTSYRNIQDQEFQYSNSEINIPAFANDTYLTIYVIDNQVDFSANYDFNGVHETMTLNELIEEKSGNEYQAKHLAQTIDEYKSQGTLSMNFATYQPRTLHIDPVFNIFFKSILLKGNGAQTTIELIFPSLEFGTLVEGETRYLYYDFYLDTERYKNQSIPVTITVQSDYTSVSNTYGITAASTINDFSLGTELNFAFSTVYREPT